TGGDRHAHLAAENWEILREGFGADGVLDEVRCEFFDQFAAADGLGEVEALVEVDAPVAGLTYALAGLRGVLEELVEAFVRVEDAVGRRVGGAHAESAVSGADRQLRAFLDAHAGPDAGDHARRVVALAVVANRAAEHRVYRKIEGLATNVPK